MQMPRPTQGFPKFKRFSFRNPKPQRTPFAGGGVAPGNINDQYQLPSGGGQYQQYNPSGQITGNDNSTFSPGPGGNPSPTPGTVDIPPDNTAPDTTGPSYSNLGNGNPPDIPFGPYPPLPGVMPDGSYNGPGSGAPTRNLVGLGAGLAGNLIFPGAGLLTGNLAKILMKSLQGPVGAAPGQPTAPQTPSQPQGGNAPSYGGFNPFGGLPPGFTEGNRDYQGGPNENTQTGGAPNFTFTGDTGPQWDGGSIFGGRGSPTVPGSGFLNNQSSLPTLGGGHSDYGADMALHSGTFRNAIQGMGYNNLNQFLNQTGFRLPGQVGGGQGIGGGSRPMTQNFSGGGVAQGEDQTTPEQMAEVYAMIMRDNEQKRREAMNEAPARRNDIEPMFSDLEQQIAAQPAGKTSISFAGGGRVPFLPKQQQVQGMGSDTVPAALTPGEIVLNKPQQAAVMPRPGMKSKLKPAELSAIEIAIRKKKQAGLQPSI